MGQSRETGERSELYHPNGRGTGISRRAVLKSTLASSIAVGSIPVMADKTEAQQSTSDDWPMFQFDAVNTGNNPATNGVETNIQEKWTFATDDRVFSSPAIVDGVLYISGRDHQVYAIDAETGDEQWMFETDDEIFSSPAVVDGTVYIGSDDSILYALDADNGSQKWTFETGNRVPGSPTVHNGTVYIGSHDSAVYAIDAESGSLVWRFETGGFIGATPAVTGRSVYVGSSDTKMYALAPETGTIQWEYETEGEIRKGPAVAGGTVYFGTNRISTSSKTATNVYAVDGADGTEIWTFDTSGRVGGSPAVADGVVYISAGRNLYALRAEEGTQLWKYDTGNHVSAPPTVVNETVYVGGTDNELHALDVLDGSERWTFDLGDSGVGVNSAPAVVDKVVYFGANSSNPPHVYAVEGDVVRIKVKLDIRPCSDTNAINPNDGGVIPVAIKHTDKFDPVERVNVGSLRFGAPDVVEAGGGASPVHDGHVKDTVPCNGDGKDDLVLHFPTEDTGFEGDEDKGKLVGRTNDDIPLFGTDNIKIVG